MSLWRRFGVVLGAIFRHFSLPDRSWTPIFFKNVDFPFPGGTLCFRERFSPLETTPGRPKSTPRGDFFALKFRPRFWIDFWSILPPKMPPLGHPFRHENRSKNRSEIGSLKKSPPDRPKTLPRAPQGRPRPPQDRPRPPKMTLLGDSGVRFGCFRPLARRFQ